ncbi:MAG: protoheme IX farnesyltransferase [Bdellovibrionaceae bacterium]|nr:protoheme IX farnesyltransferase [Pseudobdellovibrionaceae bacterium]
MSQEQVLKSDHTHVALSFRQQLEMIHNLTKMPLVYFVVLSGVAGFGYGFPQGNSFHVAQFSFTIFGLMLLSMGSFALNQIQEVPMDLKMPRTQKRPLPLGVISMQKALTLSLSFLLIGLYLLYIVSPLAALIGLVTAVFYNVIYTYILKPNWAFAAVPGAIPGALPAITAFVAAGGFVFSMESLYLFSLIFLWQMPHYWSLAIRYKEDYAQGGVPVLPVTHGNQMTLLYMLKYYLAYVFLVMLSPVFVHIDLVFLGIIVPVFALVTYHFYNFYKIQTPQTWRPFFHWINHSLLIFVAIPVIDKWLF